MASNDKSFLHDPRNTMYLGKNPSMLLNLKGNVLVYCIESIIPSLAAVLSQTLNALDESDSSVFSDNQGTRYCLVDIAKHAHVNQRGWDKIFIVNIDSIDPLIVFEVLSTCLKETHANNPSGSGQGKLGKYFTNIYY